MLVNKVKEFRTIAGISQGKLAELAGLSRQCINEVENEKNKYTKSTAMEAIAKALGRPVADIFFIAQ